MIDLRSTIPDRNGAALIMRDSDVPGDIPAGTSMVAGYVDGYAAAAWNGPSGWARFPSIPRVHISVFGNPAHMGDVENGDMTPADAPGFVARSLAAGIRKPVIYCNRATQPAVEAALLAAGVGPAHAMLLIATLDGTRTVAPSPNGFTIVGVQFAGSNLTGGHYDESIILADWPGLTVSPLVAAPTPPFTVAVHAGAHWFGAPNGQDMGPVNLPGGTELHVPAVNPKNGQPTTAADTVNWWCQPDIGAWWLKASDVDLVTPPAPPVTPPTPPATPYATQADLDALTAEVRSLQAAPPPHTHQVSVSGTASGTAK